MTTVAALKFIGVSTLGLLTVCHHHHHSPRHQKHQLTVPQGVSYTLSTQSLPSLLTLPSAKPAAYTLGQQNPPRNPSHPQPELRRDHRLRASLLPLAVQSATPIPHLEWTGGSDEWGT